MTAALIMGILALLLITGTPISIALGMTVMLCHPGSVTNRASAPGAAASITPGSTGSPFTVPRTCGPNTT